MVQIIGHRGAPALVPENTIESFKKAIEDGADYLECDVHMSRDNRMVVIHDDRLERTTNGSGFVRDFTLKQLKALRISGGLSIPTIEEVLAFDFPVMIELKSYHDGTSTRTYDGLAPRLLKLLGQVRPHQEIVIEFTNQEYSEQLKGTSYKRLNLLPEIKGFESLDTSGLFAIGVFYKILDAKLVEESHKRNLKVFSWPREDDEIERAILSGLDLLLSNNPAHAIEVARRLGRR